jgi:uncharacterized protein YfaP (DUF2135 family)
MIEINLANKIRSSLPYPPPPPPKPKKSRTLISAIAVVLLVILLIPVLFLSGVFNPPGIPNASPSPSDFPSLTSTPIHTSNPTAGPTATPSVLVPPGRIDMVKSQNTQIASQTIDSTGGTIQVTDSSSPMNGLKIDVPSAATTEPIRFDVSYSTISSITGLPDRASVASKVISIETSGSATFNQYKMFEKPIEVTLPYDSSEVNNDNSPVRFYWYDSQTGKLDSAGFLSENKAAHTITFLTGSFSDFVAVRTLLNNAGASWNIDVPVDTGFRPTRDGWYIPNYGSYLSNQVTGQTTAGGFCLGMVSYAKWYYTNIATGMRNKYIQGIPTEWRDDATAIQLAARAHLATSGIWTSLTQEEKDWATANAREVALSWISGMIVTGEPQLIGLKARTNNGTWLDYAHAVMTYSYGNGKFEIYDPNFPDTQPGDAMREIPFTYQTGFTETYVSGTTRADSLVFNIFYHAGSKLSATSDDYKGLYDSAETGFQGNSLFPEVVLTDDTTSPAGSTPSDTDGDGVRDTTEAKTTISGTITGGVEAITSTLIFVNNQKYTAAVIDGVFSKEVPLLAGDNNVAILATSENAFSRWAGFLSDTIKSSASPASFIVTLSWDHDSSDVDLHVQEPGTEGRHIYYNNKGYSEGNPYLDIDNRVGYGPEHYYATEGMTLPGSTNLYGTYQVRVNYYADHSGAEQTQAISWHLSMKYMAFKDLQTGQEFWVEESRSGVLSTDDSSNTGDFYNSSPGWTDIWTIEYVAPDPQDYGIPPPPQNQFPT